MNILTKGLFYWVFILLSCQNKDLATQVSGVYKVHHLQVFDEVIDTSNEFAGVVTITRTDISQVKLGIDIRRQKDEPTPVETVCSLLSIKDKIQLIEMKTNEILGYVENGEVYLNSSDSKGAKTEIVGKQL
jgi:hypothetical protein